MLQTPSQYNATLLLSSCLVIKRADDPEATWLCHDFTDLFNATLFLEPTRVSHFRPGCGLTAGHSSPSSSPTG